MIVRSKFSAIVEQSVAELDVVDSDTPTSPPIPEEALAATLQLWHERMAHFHRMGILNMARNKVVDGRCIKSEKDATHEPQICLGCAIGKLHRSSITRDSMTRADCLLDFIHTGVAGPLAVRTLLRHFN